MQRRTSIWPGLLLAAIITVISVGAPLASFHSLGPAATTSSATTSSATGSTGAPDTTGTTSTLRAAAATAYELRTVKLASGKSVVARWNPCQSAITYRVNLSGLARSKRAAMLKTVKAGFAQLAAADGMTYRYKGTTTFIPRTGNLAQEPAEIVVAAVSRRSTDLGLTADSLGFGGVMWNTWSGSNGEGAAVVRGYVVLNSDSIGTLKAGFGAGRTQGNVVLHELGHATGLDHSHAKGEEMNPVLTSSAPDGYAAGDRAGLKKVGAAAGCIAIPSAVTTKDLS